MRVRMSYVYFVQNTSTNKIKIGFSCNPVHRLRQLSTGTPDVLALMATIPLPAPTVLHVEQLLHSHFAPCRLKKQGHDTEWFIPAPGLMRFILSEEYRVTTPVWQQILTIQTDWFKMMGGEQRVVVDTEDPGPWLIEDATVMFLQDATRASAARPATLSVTRGDDSVEVVDIRCIPVGPRRTLMDAYAKTHSATGSTNEQFYDDWIKAVASILTRVGIGEYYTATDVVT